MLFGDPSKLALESSITRVIRNEDRIYPSGFFVIHVGGFCYGVHQPDATLLGCSVGEVAARIVRRGEHVVPFGSEPAPMIADAFRDAIYAPGQEQRRFFGIPHPEFERLLYARHVGWAPDGDEAFDDGSYVLQFDVGEKVRIVAFRCTDHGYHHEPATLRDVWMDGGEFYGILSAWHMAYSDAWRFVRDTPNA